MKLKELINNLNKVKEFCDKHKIKDPEIRVDNDENGFYELEGIEIDTDEEDVTFINLKSSNEV